MDINGYVNTPIAVATLVTAPTWLLVLYFPKGKAARLSQREIKKKNSEFLNT